MDLYQEPVAVALLAKADATARRVEIREATCASRSESSGGSPTGSKSVVRPDLIVAAPRHTGQVDALWLSLMLGAPWLVAIAWTWSRVPRTDRVPPSLGDLARQRLWTT